MFPYIDTTPKSFVSKPSIRRVGRVWQVRYQPRLSTINGGA